MEVMLVEAIYILFASVTGGVLLGTIYSFFFAAF